MALKDQKYKYGQTVLSVIGCDDHKQIRVSQFPVLRTSGVEDPADKIRPAPGTVNAEKLDCNISRARSKIFELAMCNHWDFFFTGTLDPAKADRSDLNSFHRRFVQYLLDLRKRKGFQIKFLLVPELHADRKNWHMHGLISGLPLSELRRFAPGDRMSAYLNKKIMDGQEVYTWPGYAERFGFCDVEPLRCEEAAAKYITKYVTKDLANSVTALGAHMYYCSRGLKRAEKIKSGMMFLPITPDYVGDHCAVKTFPYSDDLLRFLCDHIDSDSIGDIRNAVKHDLAFWGLAHRIDSAFSSYSSDPVLDGDSSASSDPSDSGLDGDSSASSDPSDSGLDGDSSASSDSSDSGLDGDSSASSDSSDPVLDGDDLPDWEYAGSLW